MLKLSSLLVLPVLAFTCLTAKADSLYTFESVPQYTPLPFTLTSAGIDATFSGNGTTLDSGGNLSTLSGIVLAEYANQGQPLTPLTVQFSIDLSSLSFDFATQQQDDLLVTYYEGASNLGTYDITPSVPAGYSYPEGFASFSGTFNSISITTLNGSNFAVDNFDAVAATPEPSSLCLLGTGIAGFACSLRRRLSSRA